MTESSILEQVARSCAVACCGSPDMWTAYAGVAIKAMEALQWPSDSMLTAGATAALRLMISTDDYDDIPSFLDETFVKSVYQAMLKEAIEEALITFGLREKDDGHSV